MVQNKSKVFLESESLGNSDISLNIFIDYSNKLIFRLLSISESEPKQWKIDFLNQDQLHNLLNELDRQLQGIIKIDKLTSEQLKSINSSVIEIGHFLFNNLLPRELQEISKNWKENYSIAISLSHEIQYIPWELVYDGQRFWGEKFIFSRLPRYDGSSDLDERIRPIFGKRKLRNILNIVSQDSNKNHLDKSNSEQLFKQLQLPPKVTLIEQSFSQVDEVLKSDKVDVIHLTRVTNLNIDLDYVKKLENISGGLVFLNTGLSAIPVLDNVGNLTSLAWEFYLKGADVVVGTLAQIPDNYMIGFAEYIYNKIFDRPNKTIGEAITLAKREALSKNNIFWLLYCFYGNPDFTFYIPRSNKIQTVKRSTHIDFPSECILGQEVELKIKVIIDTLKLNNNNMDNENEGMKVFVDVAAPSFNIQENPKILTLPFDKNSEEVVFKLTPVIAKEQVQVVEISLIYQGSRIGYTLAETLVKPINSEKIPN